MPCNSTSDSATLSLTGDAAIVRGASYSFGIIPKEIVPPATNSTFVWPLSECSASAIIYRDEACKQALVTMAVEMPTVQGDPILFSLEPSETAALPHSVQGVTCYIKVLLTRADGAIEPRGFGPVKVVA